ncbi:MAG: hypothetical protein Q4D87_05500 [Actinomycetaceae bacterium]|nr:hypothetical protein [Actinomycetaceae bacterium]
MKNRGLVSTLLALTVIFFAPISALAVPGLDSSSHVYDEVGILSDEDKAGIEDDVSALASEGIPYYLVVTRDFEDLSMDDWCFELGQTSNIESSAVVWALATDIGEYNLCVGPAASVSQSHASDAARQGAQNLDSDNLNGASIAAATSGMTSVLLTGGDQTAPDPGYEVERDSLTVTAISYIIVFIIFALPVVVIILIIRAMQKKSRKKIQDANKASTIADPAERANRVNVLLMNTDDTVRAAADDLAFAIAQFGELETDRFKSAVSTAENKMTEAFQLQSKYSEASSDKEKHAILDRIERICNEVVDLLDSHVKQFSKLRDIEANIGSNITSMRSRVTEARARNRRSEREIESLKLTHTTQTIYSILDNPETADRLLDAASKALDDASAMQDSNRKDAVFSINIAQRALGQALAQIDEVMNASKNLDNAKQRLADAIASISSDLNDVDKLARGQMAFDVLVADAKEAITFGHEARKGQADPLSALSKLREAEDALDRALAPLRNKHSQDTRNRKRLDDRFGEVDDAIMRADAHISAHLYTAGNDARELVADAKNKRRQAANIASTNAGEALTLLSDALIAANRAIDLTSGPSNGGYRNFPQPQQQGGLDIGSMILGGLLFGGGGGHRGGGFGSSGGSFGSGGGFSSGGSGSFGGFGGFGSGGSGSFGGGFSSGGSGKF